MINFCEQRLYFSRRCTLFLLAIFASFSVAYGQNGIKGTVHDAFGEPLAGVSIQEKGTSNGTITSIDGKYELTLTRDDARVVFSYLGYVNQEISPNKRSILDIVLVESTSNLDEVVVVGYGTQKKRNIVGAVEHISGEILENRPNAYLLRSLQGQVPGVNITMVDGKPSRSASINIRGNVQSIGAGGSTLCLIDGVEGDLTAMNPEDVASITVLKDASSAAVYGARGAFGVILVTTKKAKEDKVSVNYSGNLTLYTPTVRPRFETDSQIWYDNFKLAHVSYRHALPTGINNFFPWSQEWENEYKKRINDPDKAYLDWGLSSNNRYQYYSEGTDWYNEFYKKETFGHQHNLSVSGGNKTTNFIVSSRFFEQDGIYRIGDENFKQVNLRAKGTIKITDWLTVEDHIDFVRRSYHQPHGYPTNLTTPRLLEHQGFPVAKLKNPDGTWTAAAVYTGYAPMAEGVTYRDNFKYDMKNTVSLTMDVLKDVLQVKADYTYLYNHSKRTDVVNSVTYSDGPDIQLNYPTISSLDKRDYETEYNTANAYLSFSPQIAMNHSLNIMGGWNIEHKKYYSTSMYRDGFLKSDKPNFSLMDGIDLTLSDGGSYAWGFMGLFYRVSYGFKGKYLAEASGRYDGSSKFPSNQKWGFFPSVSLGWRMSEEGFMKDQVWLDNLKWRVSVGQAGNGNVDPYKYLALLSISKANVLTNGTSEAYTSAPEPIPTSLTWETATTYDVGLDLDVLQGRLNFTGDIYQKNTADMYVVGAEIPAVAGYSAPKGNNADMETKGYELSVGWHDKFTLKDKKFSYNARLSFWDASSKITKYTSKTNILPTIYANSYYQGMTLGEIWGYHVLGLFETDEEAQEYGVAKQSKTFWSGDNVSWNAGDLKFADLDDSGEVDNGNNTLENHGDLRKIGNSTPRYHYGLNVGANWNGFGISAFFQGVLKRDWYPAGESGFFWGQYNRTYGFSLPWQNSDRWTEDNPNVNAYWPRLRGSMAATGRGTLRLANDRYLQNAKYCRLKNLTVDYTLPKSITKKMHLEALKVYLSGENLYFWSPLKKHAKNFDPEQITPGDADYGATAGTDGQGYGYPQTRSVSLGVNVSF